ncbi:glycine betaine ABC transporter substrate-binding protein [Endozoicomonas sp. G2_2]|uniref:glycine betaine ABC transporter substrate-binding protein n=1 Tax=Endozoicomonas sp. G2_2 TaxID=2821092 RepID=UPI001ADBE1E5|nr:glycine betaine ABC transporter substrate-binding protein [Endozoicomonas sp. G2_2]MBO9471326.1 glycine betaine ABC transporter substrate-binding protein [Endozoicomonas sp. G2_2]
MRHIALRMAAAALALLVVTGPAMAADEPVTIYTDNYAADEAMSRVARDLIEQHFDTPVELKPVSVGVSFVGTARDERSMFLAAWLPATHGEYMARVEDDVVNLGTIYTGAKLGWVVPDYVPADQLGSIEDLKNPAVAERLNGRIQGISAGAGLMQLSNKAVEEYALDDYRLITASGPAMTAALKRAIENEEWIVVTGWSPHWKWERFDLRYLDDPKGTLGGEEHVDAIASPALVESEPEITDFIRRMTFELDQINPMLAEAERTSYDEAAETFIKEHPDLIESWLEGE